MEGRHSTSKRASKVVTTSTTTRAFRKKRVGIPVGASSCSLYAEQDGATFQLWAEFRRNGRSHRLLLKEMSADESTHTHHRYVYDARTDEVTHAAGETKTTSQAVVEGHRYIVLSSQANPHK
jgi:hypothetical protein